MKNDASIALSCPQNRTARRVWSYDRLWFGKSITGLITSSHDDSDRDRNEQTIAVDCGLQRSFRRNDDLATHPPQQLDAFGPLPFSATMKAQRIYHAHWVNLTDIRSGADRYFTMSQRRDRSG
jgi:hypothetical protein